MKTERRILHHGVCSLLALCGIEAGCATAPTLPPTDQAYEPVVTATAQRARFSTGEADPLVDARASSVELQREAAVEPRLAPDGNLIVSPKEGGSYSQRESDRYQCDTWAADVTGYDPTKKDGGVGPHAEAAGRAEYLRAEAACFEARGYTVR
jgi:hypothetical protein